MYWDKLPSYQLYRSSKYRNKLLKEYEQKKYGVLLPLIDDLIGAHMSIKESKQHELEYLKKQLIKTNGTKKVKLSKLIIIDNERNSSDNTEAVAVGKYGIRLRSEIYSNELSKIYPKIK